MEYNKNLSKNPLGCNTDLEREREICTFDKREITIILDGGEHYTELRKNLGKFYIVRYLNITVCSSC